MTRLLPRMLTPLAPDSLWVADMRAARAGFEFGARMTVLRLPDGGLWLHSPIELTPDLRAELDALGPVRALVAPSRLHFQHLAEFHRGYPDAKVYAVLGLAPRLAGHVDEFIMDAAPPEWGGSVEMSCFQGSRLYDEVDFYHAASRTLILTDLLFNIPPDRGWTTRLVAGALGFLGRPSPSRSFPLTIRDRAAVRRSLERIMAWDFDRIILCHGTIVGAGGREVFRNAFPGLLGLGSTAI